MNINIPGLLCTAAVNCTHVGELQSPFTYIQPYREGTLAIYKVISTVYARQT